jgi:hypothetical protein
VSGGRRPVASLAVRRKEGDAWKSYSVVSAWPTDYPGVVNVSLDKGTERRPAMGPIDAIKALAAGASWEFRFNGASSERAAPPASDGFGGGDDWGGQF